MSTRQLFTRPARRAAIAPYLWMVLFFLLPFAFVAKIALSQSALAQPPYLPTFDLTAGWEALKAAAATLSLDNFRRIFSDEPAENGTGTVPHFGGFPFPFVPDLCSV